MNFTQADYANVVQKATLIGARFRLSNAQREDLVSQVLEAIVVAGADQRKLRTSEEIGMFAYETARVRALDLLAEEKRQLSPYGEPLHPWLDEVRAYVRAVPIDEHGRVCVEAKAVAQSLGKQDGEQGVGKCLSLLGFQRHRHQVDGKRSWRWVWP